MNLKSVRFALLLGLVSLAASAFAKVSNGDQAPGFSLPSAGGETVALSDFAGKYVVLEWINPHCPFVRKFYEAGAMQALQEQAQEKGVVWLTINSTTSSHRQYVDPAETQEYIAEKGVESIWLFDEPGEVGKLYGATNTPQMFVIDPDGVIIYQGAIDDQNSASPSTLEKAHNYVMAALNAAFEGKPIDVAQTRPYGCGVKY